MGETLKPTVTGSGAGAPAAPLSRIGRFVVRKALGKGAFGTVYLATDPTLSRDVAIKIPHDGLTPELKARFLREARATATVHHPNVCPVYEVGTHGDVPYIVMHYVAGTTLAAFLNERGALPPAQAVAVAQKLALGIGAAHEKGVVHRDLKPANVLFDPARTLAVITDFGLAIRASDVQLTADGSVCGTPAYMSPEQAKGKTSEVGPLSDVYSLGVILYHLLTGEVPFRGITFAVLAQHVKAAPVPPSQVRSGLAPRLDALVLKALAKQPADRYPSAKAFADALAAYATGDTRTAPALPVAAPPEPQSKAAQTVVKTAPPKAPLPAVPPVAARPVPPPRPKPKPKDNSRKLLAVGGALLALVLVAGVLAPRLVRSFAGRSSPTSNKSEEPAATKAATPAPKTGASVVPKPKDVEPKKVDPKPPEPDRAAEASRQSVKAGLEWLAAQQMADGGWRYDLGDHKDERAAATGMALRPFLWARAASVGRDDKTDRIISRGLDFLYTQCQPDGQITKNMYAQAIATLALCEGYGVTKDPFLKKRAQAAINHIDRAQGPNGSWGYVSGTNGDTSITGWQVQAMQAAKEVGLVVDGAVGKKTIAFLDTTAAGTRKSMYGYVVSTGAKPGTALTAIGLLCRYHLDGWNAAHPGMIDGVSGLMQNGPPSTGGVRDLYYFYYATRVVRYYGGDEWATWSEGPKGVDGVRKGGIRDWLVGEQVTRDGVNLGSWEPENGSFGSNCGRLGTTAVAVSVLQMCDRDR